MHQTAKVFLTLLFSFSIYLLCAQSFEGTITYKVTMGNPNPEAMSDEDWNTIMKEQLGERGYMVQKYYYKGNRYMSEIDAGQQLGYQAYNHEDSLIYSWAKDTEEAVTLDSRKQMDKLTEISEGTGVETIAGIECKSIIVKSGFGTMTLWYNSEHLQVDPSLYKGHVYAHFEQITDKIGCLPLMIKQEGLMGKLTLEAMEFKAEPVDDATFEIPSFKSVTPNPVN